MAYNKTQMNVNVKMEYACKPDLKMSCYSLNLLDLINNLPTAIKYEAELKRNDGISKWHEPYK